MPNVLGEELSELQVPHSVLAEQAVLGSILIDPQRVSAVVEVLRADDFYMRQNQALYQAVFTMFNQFKTIDLVTVIDQMKADGAYDESTTVPYLHQLMAVTPTAANVLDYAAIVADKAKLRRMGETFDEQIGRASCRERVCMFV